MIDNLPTFISLTFGLTTVATLLLFIWTIRNSNSETTRKKSIPILIGLTIWLVIQTIDLFLFDNEEFINPFGASVQP